MTPVKDLLKPGVLRAGGIAAVLALSVSGGAYAAVQAAAPGGDAEVLPEAVVVAAGATTDISADDPAAGEGTDLVVGGDAAEVSSVTEDVTEEFARVEQETDALPEGETEVETEGVDGVTRVVYRVTSVDGKEVSREVVSRVVVSERVDEVVLVGTGTADAASTDTAGTDSGSTTATASGDGTTAASAQSIAQSMMSSYGWDDSQFSCLVSLWNRESGWNYLAQNPSSGAYGIPQALPGSKMSSVASDWATNPTTQIKWGLGYISGRYGTPCSAWAHSESTGWY